MAVPTFDELVQRLKKDARGREEMREVFRRVACGERHPTKPPLPDNMVVLAAQAMTILFSHADGTAEPRECPTCMGYGHLSEDGEPTIDRSDGRCLDCRGTGKVN